jgi:HPt (histidine-containing phosphotransfer) domain-containing protein
MAKTQNEKPTVTTFADHEVIVPPNKLERAVTKAPAAKPGAGEDDPVARAEAALAKLASEFVTWMEAECERLDEARRKIKTFGLDTATGEQLFRAAHDIKGEAETFGFPHAGHVAESLCRLIEHTPDWTRIPLSLVDQHVDAVRAIIREIRLAEGEKTASRLVAQLRQVTDNFLARENRHRPDYLDDILGPPLAPGDGGRTTEDR